MSRRWFVANVGVGAANEAKPGTGPRLLLKPEVKVIGQIGAAREEFPAAGPDLALIGPGDVLGFERSLVVREEPAAGSTNGVAENLACVEFSDGSLPWQFSLPADKFQLPWMVLLVLRSDEGTLRGGSPLPVVDAPAAALPDLDDSWAWAHVEARVADDAQSPHDDVVADVRSGSQTVISRLICPRKLEPNKDWLACVVPATNAGVAAGLGDGVGKKPPFAPAWNSQTPEMQLPVYHSWRFQTGEAGAFEDLARLVEPVDVQKLAAKTGFGSRAIGVRRPWPQAKVDPLKGAPKDLSTSIQGALRVPGTEVPEEVWSETDAQGKFVKALSDRLDAPDARFGKVAAEPDRDELAVAPPLYGSHFTGLQKVPGTGWVAALNLQVRHRLGAALGSRYVQLEQEFLMARAWEQLGAINEANRLLAVGELSSEISLLAQDKHLAKMNASEVTLLADPIRTEVQIKDHGSLEQVLEGSALPDGAASSPFRRLTRTGGGLARRAARIRDRASAGARSEGLVIDPTINPMPESPPVLAAGLNGERFLLPSAESVTAEAAEKARFVVADPASLAPSRSLVGLLGGQVELFELHDREAQQGIATAAKAALQSTSAATVARAAPSPRLLRGLRRRANTELLVESPQATVTVQLEVETVASSVRDGLLPLGQQLTRIEALIPAGDPEQRSESDERPLRRIMSHPRFGMPIAAELLSRWPEWALPGITGFPANSATLVETNSPFVEAVLVGLNQEFNRELLWREFPTDQRGTAFARFWPSEVDNPDVDEIARWDTEVALGDHDETGGQDLLVLLVRADVLRRFPGTTVLAAKAIGDGPKKGQLPDEDDKADWKQPTFLLAVDEQTALFGFDLQEGKARDEKWLFVLREPMRGTQFGFDTRNLKRLHWADLDWDDVPLQAGFVVPRVVGDLPPTPEELEGPDPGAWGTDAADVARIAFQRPFQLAVSARMMLGEKGGP